MGKVFGKPSAPPAPDYAAAATAQGAANRDTALASWQLSNANQITPWGTKTTTQSGPKDTDYTVTTALNPADQAILDQQRGVQKGIMDLAPSALNTANNALNSSLNVGNLPPMAYQVDTKGLKNLDYSGLPGQQYSVGDTGDIRNKVENAAWGKYIDRAAPMMQQQTNNLNTRLANMGGVTTSPGAMRAQSALQTSQGDQARQAIFDSILQGGNAAQQEQGMRLNDANLWNQARSTDAGLLKDQTNFNNTATQQDIQNAFSNASLTNSSRQQGLNEAAQLRQMPLNELLAMLNGTQINSPQFQPVAGANIQPAPLFQAAQAQGAADQQGYQNQMGGWNSLLSGLGSLGSAGITAWSDRRLKSDIVPVGKTPGGFNVYEYTIFGRRERGVMADEVAQVLPSAVIRDASGYDMVDYSKVT
jgi:hypothetical protein